jgi:GTPase Era involved in 16S rRNA processing
MKIIIGSSDAGKSTVLLNYVYNELAKLIEPNPDAELPTACIITSKKHLTDRSMIFGIYGEVSVEILK